MDKINWVCADCGLLNNQHATWHEGQCDVCGQTKSITERRDFSAIGWWHGKDEWFDLYWSSQVTPEFAAWWLAYYGSPTAFMQEDEANGTSEEYFRRMAFALMGWRKAKGLPL